MFMRKFMDIIKLAVSNETSSTPEGKAVLSESAVLNEMEEAGGDYTIEPDGDGEEVKVYKHDTYPDHSVLAGQARKRFIDRFPTKEAAIEHYPSAHVGYRSANNTFGHLPGEDDPVAGGMFPDDFAHEEIEEVEGLGDDVVIPEPDDIEDGELFRDIDDAHERAMRRLDDYEYDAGLEADSMENYHSGASARDGYNEDGEPL